MKILSRKAIKKVISGFGIKSPVRPDFSAVATTAEVGTEAQIQAVCEMAEQYRRIVRLRQRDRRRRRAPAGESSTGYLTLEQFAHLINIFEKKKSERDSLTLKIIIFMTETGLRSEEACQIQMRDLPVYHGHSSVEVRKGKGGRRRSVVISQFLRKFIEGSVQPGWTKTEYYLKNERGKRITYPALYARLKRAFTMAIIPWAHNHTLRHTFNTHLAATGAQPTFRKRQLGHARNDVTDIYTHDIEEISKNQMEAFHNRLWCYQKQGLLPYSN